MSQYEVGDRGNRVVARLDLAYPGHRLGVERVVATVSAALTW